MPPMTQAEYDEVARTHKWEIASTYLMCADGFEREYWRGECSCGACGKWKFYRSLAQDDWYAHVVDLRYPDLTQVITGRVS